MQIIDLYSDGSNLEEVAIKTSNVLKQGGVIIYPTDTVYGMGVDANNIQAVQKIEKIKQRDQQKKFSVIVKDFLMIKKYSFYKKKDEAIMQKLLPGKVTFVLKSKIKLAMENVVKRNQSRTTRTNKVENNANSIGIRIPNHPFTQKLSKIFNKPYITTSVNISGEEPLFWGTEIIDYFKTKKEKPDLLIDAGKIATENEQPEVSTVIDLTGENLKILRIGAISIQKVFKTYYEISNKTQRSSN